jgi:uncharacterized damage-inducible protein DinB
MTIGRRITPFLLGAALLLAAMPVHAQSASDAVTAGLLSRFETVSGNILTAAERVPEDRYSYRPTEEVRTMGELFLHVAQAHFGYCAAAGGEAVPASVRQPAASKAEIVERVRQSRDFCLQVYRRNWGDALAETLPLFGGTEDRATILIQNVAHDNLHYGNIVTYMRSIGLVPPSSD